MNEHLMFVLDYEQTADILLVFDDSMSKSDSG